MLKPVRKKKLRVPQGEFFIIASKYNARYVDAMLRAAQGALKEAGVTRVQTIRVPGAFEIPAVASSVACQDSNDLAAIICLGVVIRGETAHAQLVAEGVTHALAGLQVSFHLPVIHGVLLLDNEEQARVRCLGKEHNRGLEAAQTALAMAAVMEKVFPDDVPF
jgi:6,7-dimethyl-8-ribityllumazine synthase